MGQGPDAPVIHTLGPGGGQETESRQVYALLWAEDPTTVAEVVCAQFTRLQSEPPWKQELHAPIWMLSYLHDPAVVCPAADTRTTTLRPCCDDNCEWAAPLPAQGVVLEQVLGTEPLRISDSTYVRTYRVARGLGLDETVEQAVARLEYAVEQEGPPCIGIYAPDIACSMRPERLQRKACTLGARTLYNEREYTAVVDDANRRIHHVRSSGAIEPPVVTVQLSEDGEAYRCTFEGTAPFEGFKHSTVAWQLDDRALMLDGDQLPAARTSPGDRLTCHFSIAPLKVPTVREFLSERRVTGDARTFASEEFVVSEGR